VNDPDFRAALVDAVWRAADRVASVRSATLAGSFSKGTGLEGIADIDTILIVDSLDEPRFAELQEAFRDELEPILSERLYALRINPTLGPLKFNDPRTAVLHLMIYTAEGHREHAIKSPFTCLDWQRSALWHKSDLKSIYPVFGLQPHHFMSARRGARDYLRDLAEDAVSYRELSFRAGGLQEIVRKKPMTSRDRHEFAYHVMRFLMQNFLKLVTRSNEVQDGEALLTAYFARFPEGAGDFGPLFQELNRRKQASEFKPAVPNLFERVSGFVTTFEQQFRDAFERRAVRHMVFRHAPTELNGPTGEGTVFQGRVDPHLPYTERGMFPYPEREAFREGLERLAEAVRSHRPVQVYTSPLQRAIGSVVLLGLLVPWLPEEIVDERLVEIDYGQCEELTVAEAQERYPELFAAWARGEDPPFPGGGENTAAVCERLWDFAEERWQSGNEPTLACAHNVVLRCLIGHLLSVPPREWYRLRIPHLVPLTVLSTERFGLFVDLEEAVEREIFADFFADSRQ